MSRLYDLKCDFHAASGGLWIDELTPEEDAVKDALQAGHAVVIEVAAVSEAITVHAVAQDDMATFQSLAAWCAFECSGRENQGEATFYRVDVEPVEVTEFRSSFPPPQQSGQQAPAQEGEKGGEQGAGGAGPVKSRPPAGDELLPEPGQVAKKPRGR